MWNNFLRAGVGRLKTGWAITTHQAKEKKHTLNQIWKGRPHLTINPTSDTATHSKEGTQKQEILPQKQKTRAPHGVPQLLRPTYEKWAPQTSSFENQQRSHVLYKTLRLPWSKKQILKSSWITLTHPMAQPIVQTLSERESFACITTLTWGAHI